MYDQRRKRSQPENSSSRMDPDVIKIMPPIVRGTDFKPLKQKQVVHEIIDVDMDADESCYSNVKDGKGDLFNKGKEIFYKKSKVASSTKLGKTDALLSTKNSSLGSNKSVNQNGLTIDLSLDDDEYFHMLYDGSPCDDHTLLQAQYNNVDIKPGVEAPIPLLQKKNASAASPMLNSLPNINATCPLSLKAEHSDVMMKPNSVSSTCFQNQNLAASQSNGVGPDSFVKSGKGKVKLNTTSSSEGSGLPAYEDTKNLKVGAKSSKSWWCPRISRRKNKQKSNLSSHPVLDKQVNGFKDMDFLPDETEKIFLGSQAQAELPKYNLPPVANPPTSSMDISSTSDPYLDKPYDEEAFIPWAQNMKKCKRSSKASGRSSNLQESISVVGENANEDILKMYELYKHFDTVQDHSDHHYSKKGSSVKQPAKNWTKHLQGEWRILEKNLPERIFVRVYESRLDLLRAVIIGAEGTPYNGGLFFFDVFFPSGYPSSPPNVYYHSGGLRLNPNLYACGKVCLSLLNTWVGSKDEKWNSGSSTMLQVLVSIQGLILNAKPYFNEPAFAPLRGSEKGEKDSAVYNESTYLLSLKTMLYTMRKPPKHFEKFVAGHFRKYAEVILVECKAYMDGAQVGCLARGGIQDVDEGDKSCSKKFKDSLPEYMKLLVKAFAHIGAKNCDRFLINSGDKK